MGRAPPALRMGLGSSCSAREEALELCFPFQQPLSSPRLCPQTQSCEAQSSVRDEAELEDAPGAPCSVSACCPAVVCCRRGLSTRAQCCGHRPTPATAAAWEEEGRERSLGARAWEGQSKTGARGCRGWAGFIAADRQGESGGQGAEAGGQGAEGRDRRAGGRGQRQEGRGQRVGSKGQERRLLPASTACTCPAPRWPPWVPSSAALLSCSYREEGAGMAGGAKREAGSTRDKASVGQAARERSWSVAGGSGWRSSCPGGSAARGWQGLPGRLVPRGDQHWWEQAVPQGSRHTVSQESTHLVVQTSTHCVGQGSTHLVVQHCVGQGSTQTSTHLGGQTSTH